MSYWTHILGVLEVTPMGRTQHEMTYILNTVLDHLPLVTGSEGDMEWFVNVNPHANMLGSHDEFLKQTNNLIDDYGNHNKDCGWLRTSDRYYITVFGSLRDRMFRETFVELQKWLVRLAKRVMVYSVNIELTADDRKRPYYIQCSDVEKRNPYLEMFEDPSWVTKGEPAWYEYLMWERVPGDFIPLKHIYKYYNDDDVDAEMERREKWAEIMRSKADGN